MAFRFLHHHHLMTFSQLVLLLCMTSFSSQFISSTQPQNPADRLALLSFKSLVSDPLGVLQSWNTSIHFCQWLGVSCSGRRHPGRVTALLLDSVNLTGLLTPHIANLTFLRNLSLSNNNLQGRIPEEFGRLYQLRVLDLSGNSLGGEIPANLSSCVNLLRIILSSNSLVGAIPPEIGLLPKLSVLRLGGNLLSGSIPSSLGNITSLRGLFLNDCGLKGKIPENLGNLANLVYFQVTNNSLSGTIPPSLYNISSLVYLTSGSNRLVGTLPPYMFDTLRSIKMLLLDDNQLSGPIPVSLPNASQLVEIDLKNNQFMGTLPSNLGLLKNLYWINLSKNLLEARNADEWRFFTSLTNCSLLGTLAIGGNMLSGELPGSVSNLSKHLDWLALPLNQISGRIPEGISNLINLTQLTLQENRFAGQIPESIGKLRKLRVLDLSRNKFTGFIPSSIGNLTDLIQLNLESSGLTGKIPASFGDCRSLQVASMSDNHLTGEIPEELLSLSSLTIFLNLSNNGLSGSLSTKVGELKNLGALDISNNRLFGEIPSAIGDCQSLQYLYMQANFFSRSIPQSLSNLKGLEVLDLSHNNLSGNIPEGLGSLGALVYLNLSFNDLAGEVPNRGVFRNSTAVSLVGNNRLCGGNKLLHLPDCYTKSSTKKKLSLALKIGIPLISIILCLIISLLVAGRLRWMKISRNIPLSTFSADDITKFSYAELLRATNGFSISNLVGVGSFGSVYKAVIGSNEETVAVKVLNLQQEGALKSFMAECEVLKSIRHRNLVKIISLCSSIDFEGNDFKALILEYMPNGSLEQWLHPKIPMESTNLSFLQRLNIGIDVASALDYLHNHGHAPIVHCDLKPSNILLDDDMCAHVSDFGLAKFLSEDSDSIHRLTGSIGVRGSIGYIAPEYGMGAQVSTRGDVYSYGILLLEMFTGRSPTDDIFEDGQGLYQYVEAAYPDQILTIIDPILFQGNEQQNKENTVELDKYGMRIEEHKVLVSVIRIALSCSKQASEDRMEITNALKEMYAIREMLRRSIAS